MDASSLPSVRRWVEPAGPSRAVPKSPIHQATPSLTGNYKKIYVKSILEVIKLYIYMFIEYT